MGCATTTVKISSIIFNIILGIFAIGCIIILSFNPDAIQEELAIGAYIIFSLLIFFAILGCFAAIRESVCLTATCAAFLLILAILQIFGAVTGMGDNEVRNAVETVNKAWDMPEEMNNIQMEHECCGKSSANDYILLSRAIPNSCYMNEDSTKPENLYSDGCTRKMQKYYDDEMYYFVVFSWALVAFEIVGFLLALFLVINFRNTQRRMQF